jgi:hypothetical protein
MGTIIIIMLFCCVNVGIAKYCWDLMFREGAPTSAKTVAAMACLTNLIIFCFNFYLLLEIYRNM